MQSAPPRRSASVPLTDSPFRTSVSYFFVRIIPYVGALCVIPCFLAPLQTKLAPPGVQPHGCCTMLFCSACVNIQCANEVDARIAAGQMVIQKVAFQPSDIGSYSPPVMVMHAGAPPFVAQQQQPVVFVPVQPQPPMVAYAAPPSSSVPKSLL